MRGGDHTSIINITLHIQGVATQDAELMQGLDPADKAHRVFNYHRNTVHAAAELVGAAGYGALMSTSVSVHISLKHV